MIVLTNCKYFLQISELAGELQGELR